MSATRSASRYFGGLGLQIGTHLGLVDVGLPNGVRGPVVVRKRLPLIARGAGTGSKSSGDVVGLDGAVVDVGGEVQASERRGESLLGGDSGGASVIGGGHHAVEVGLQRSRVGGGERHEGDEERQQLRGCGGREGRARKVSDDAPRYRQSPKSRNVVAEAQSPGDRRRARRWRGIRGRRGHR